MSTYPMSGALPQYAKYIGEFVPDYDSVHYYYRVVAYNRSRVAITNTTDATVPAAFGPIVLDGDHAISINWSPVIGASFYQIFKGTGSHPGATDPGWYIASGSETEILDVGYPCSTRNSFLNPGKSPIYPSPCCDEPLGAGVTNVPPIGSAKPDDGHQGGGFVRMEASTARAEPAGKHGEIQWNNNGEFGASPDLIWDPDTRRLGVHVADPKYAVDVNEEHEEERD